jgi:hypothetical protein
MKRAIYAGAFLGGAIGGYLPALWHAGEFSASGLIGGTLGTFVGIWAGYRGAKYFDLD